MYQKKNTFEHRVVLRGHTLVELLVVLTIIILLAGLLISAVQVAREAARVAQCRHNLRSVVLAAMGYEGSHGRYPGVGQGYLQSGQPKDTGFHNHAPSQKVLPFMDGLADAVIDTSVHYSASAHNRRMAKLPIPTFICPSSGLLSLDSVDYAFTSYGAISGTDIDPITGERNIRTAVNGALQLKNTKSADIKDGLGYVVMFGESLRDEMTRPSFWDPVRQVWRSPWRRADPDSGLVVSAQINSLDDSLKRQGITKGFELQEEISSNHPGGAFVVFCDGHVEFLIDATDLLVMRALVTMAESDSLLIFEAE